MGAAGKGKTRLRAALYARQSKDRLQGIQAQLADCTHLCRLRDWDVTHTITDNDVSASTRKPRPGYRQLLAAVEAGEVDMIVVSHVDRLLRTMVDLEALIDLIAKHGVGLVTVSGDLDLSTDAGRLVGRILAAVARGEVERKGARQKRAEEDRATRGVPRMAARHPFGWQPNRRTLDPAEASAVADGCMAILRGGTVTGVLRDWERRGLKPHQSQEWTRTSVRQILTSPRIAGISAYKGIELGPGHWEPIVPEETLRAVQWTLGQRRRPGHAATSLLGHLALCPCGNYVSATINTRGRPSYRCNQATQDGRPGPHVHTVRAPVDEHVSALTVAWLSQADVASLVVAPDDGDAAALRDEEAVIQARLAQLGSMFMDGRIAEADVTSGRARGEERLAEIHARLAQIGRQSALTPLILAESVGLEWEALDVARKRAVIAELMTVTLFPAGTGRRFDPDTVLPPGRGIKWKS
jgi:site-specific DNA recombinase